MGSSIWTERHFRGYFRIAGDTPAKAVCAQKRAENGLLAALNRAFVFTNRYIAMPGRTDSIQVAG
jgi:hypothetical protein